MSNDNLVQARVDLYARTEWERIPSDRRSATLSRLLRAHRDGMNAVASAAESHAEAVAERATEDVRDELGDLLPEGIAERYEAAIQQAIMDVTEVDTNAYVDDYPVQFDRFDASKAATLDTDNPVVRAQAADAGISPETFIESYRQHRGDPDETLNGDSYTVYNDCIQYTADAKRHVREQSTEKDVRTT